MGRLFLTNARILTPEPSRAQGVEIEDGRIVSFLVGHSTAGRRAGDEVVDLQRMTLMPSFADAHVHLRSWALAELAVDLSEAASLRDALELLEQAARRLPADEWLRGRAWNRNSWSNPAWPSRDDLDRVTRDRPVIVESHDLHGCWANSAALAAIGLAGRKAKTASEFPVGVMLRAAGDGRLEPSGILREDSAWELVKRIPSPSGRALAQAERSVIRRLYQLGITSVTDFDGWEAASGYGKLGEPLRILASLRLEELERAEAGRVEPGMTLGNARVSLGPLKLFLDGSLGSRSAWMLEPYETGPEDCGLGMLRGEELAAAAERALALGLPLAIHAIGDRANREALDLFSRARPRHPEAVLRLEHAQLFGGTDLARVAQLGVIASVQPSHIVDDIRTADREWGKRSRLAYAFASLADSGAMLAFGSDVPVGHPDPRVGLAAARFRQDRAGRPPGGWYPSEALDAKTALAAYTTGAQAACGHAGRAGMMERGALADLVAIDGDPLGASPLDMDVRATWIGGARIE